MIHVLSKSRNIETQAPFDDAEIAWHALSFLIAGQDTTSTALALTLHYLAKFPQYQERAAAECS